MPTEFRQVQFIFHRGTGANRKLQKQADPFSGDLKAAEVALKGFELQFVGDDHNLWVEKVGVRIISRHGRDVTVEASITLADDSGFDNDYAGEVIAVVIGVT